jgi:ABC-type multidrug transport system fused ATPase/permease subunit
VLLMNRGQRVLSDQFDCPLQVGNTVHHLVTFVVSIGISLYRGWKLALVLLALTPLIAAAGFALAHIMTWGVKRMSEGYSKANVASTQAIGNIRTVASFQAETTLYDRYVAMLEYPTKLSVKIYTYSGLAGGCVNAAIFITCVSVHRMQYVTLSTVLFRVMALWSCIHSVFRADIALFGANIVHRVRCSVQIFHRLLVRREAGPRSRW